jgi:hypothetical protein
MSGNSMFVHLLPSVILIGLLMIIDDG